MSRKLRSLTDKSVCYMIGVKFFVEFSPEGEGLIIQKMILNQVVPEM